MESDKKSKLPPEVKKSLLQNFYTVCTKTSEEIKEWVLNGHMN